MNAELLTPAWIVRSELSKKPRLKLEIQMGHRAQEILRFESRIVGEHKVNVVTYGVNAEIRREMVFTPKKFESVIATYQQQTLSRWWKAMKALLGI